MGEKNIQLGCELIDCEGEIEWSIASSSGPECSIDQNGVFTPHELCHARNESCGDLYCVKAQLKGDPMTYGVAMVRIIP